MSVLIKFLAGYYRTRLRGSYRLTNFLAQRLKFLQCVPIQTESGILYADLRITSAHGILATPKSNSGEDLVMRHFIKSGEVVFDIGAHFGFYTLLLSELVGEKGKVFAFEPNAELLPSLKKTIEQLDNVELLSTALSDQEGEADFFVPENFTMAGLSDWTNGIAGKIHRVRCRVSALNNLLKKSEVSVPQFIKCDVEGAELGVFKGASEILNRVDAPALLFEVNSLAAKSFNLTSADYLEYLESLENVEFVFFEVSAAGIKKLESREIEYTNVLAVPSAKLDLCRDILI